MALKFLNKKGWHTGSLRNIENVWKAEQKHEAENRKLDELRKQILEERERDEFRLLQEQAGLTPRQERLEFLYDSGLAVGKSSSDGFKALEPYPNADNDKSASTSTQASVSASVPESSKASVPGALFEDKPQSANDAWRKLHSDPLLMIRQREQEALARIKNNPVKMAMIRKSMEANKKDDEAFDGAHQNAKKSNHKKHSSSKYHSDVENDSREGKERRKKTKHKKKEQEDSDEDSRDRTKNRRHSHREYEGEKQSEKKGERNKEDSREKTRHSRHSHRHGSPTEQKANRSEDLEQRKRSYEKSKHEDYPRDHKKDSNLPPRPDSYKRRGKAIQLTEEERAARLREMQMDAEVHEGQRWKRLKQASEDDAREASHAHANSSRGNSFLDDVHKSVYGAEKGGSSTIEESVRRRTHFLQGRSGEAHERNAFRR